MLEKSGYYGYTLSEGNEWGNSTNVGEKSSARGKKTISFTHNQISSSVFMTRQLLLFNQMEMRRLGQAMLNLFFFSARHTEDFF
jgi:hypothetical protein